MPGQKRLNFFHFHLKICLGESHFFSGKVRGMAMRQPVKYMVH